MKAIGNSETPIITQQEVRSIFKEIETGKQAAILLEFHEGEFSDIEAAYFAGAGWALNEIQMKIEGILGLRTASTVDWMEH